MTRQLGETVGGELVCQRKGCRRRWSQHAPGGGVGTTPGDPCSGFRWVDLDGPPAPASGGQR